MTQPNAFARRHGTAIGLNITRLILSSTFRYFDLTYSSAQMSVSGSLSNPSSGTRSCQMLSRQLCIRWTKTIWRTATFSSSTRRPGSKIFHSLIMDGSLEGDCEKLSTVLPPFFGSAYCSKRCRVFHELLWSLHAVLRVLFLLLFAEQKGM